MIERLLAADAALERGELDVADRLFTQVAVADPRNAIAVVGRAQVAMRRDAPAEAKELAHLALDIDPDEAAAHRLLAELEAPAVAAEVADVPAAATASPTPEQTVPAPTPPTPSWRRLLATILGRG